MHGASECQGTMHMARTIVHTCMQSCQTYHNCKCQLVAFKSAQGDRHPYSFLSNFLPFWECRCPVDIETPGCKALAFTQYCHDSSFTGATSL